MPRAIWAGAISFGMVAIPVKLYPATQSKTVAFNSLHESCNSRIRHKKYCEHHEQLVPDSEIVKAYEYSKDQYVIIEPEDFTTLPVTSTHTIGIAQFVDLDEIDPVYFDKTYYLEPEELGQKPYMLLREALKNSGKVAIARVSIRQKEHLACLRIYGDGVLMETMYFPDEIRDDGELNIPESADALSEQEVAMAQMLIDQLSGTFDPANTTDEFRQAVMAMIEAKLSSSVPVSATAAAPAPSTVVDLMAAIRESIELAKQGETPTIASAPAEEQPAEAVAT